MGKHEKEPPKINITTFPGLEGLIDPISRCVTVANTERKYLGLQVPENYSIYAHLFSRDNRTGELEEVGGKYDIHLYIADDLKHLIAHEQKEMVQRLQCYFLHVRDLLPGFSEETIFTRLPGGIFDGFKPKDSLQKEALAYVIHHAAEANDDLASLLPHLLELFSMRRSTTIRHELDHIDFMESTIFQDYRRKLQNIADMGRKYEQGTCSIYEYEEANTELIDTYCFLYTFMEGRALFFTHTKIGWNDLDYGAVAKKVLRTLSLQYVKKSFSPAILGAV